MMPDCLIFYIYLAIVGWYNHNLEQAPDKKLFIQRHNETMENAYFIAISFVEHEHPLLVPLTGWTIVWEDNPPKHFVPSHGMDRGIYSMSQRIVRTRILCTSWQSVVLVVDRFWCSWEKICFVGHLAVHQNERECHNTPQSKHKIIIWFHWR
jgi:hypothetical protein